jgi:hypothetical protein
MSEEYRPRTALMTFAFWNNPLVVHAFESPSSRNKLWTAVLGYPIGVIGLYWLAEWATGQVTPQMFLVGLIGWQLVAGFIGAFAATHGAIRTDVRQGTMESLRLTSLTPAQLLLGKMLAEPAVLYLGMLATLPLAAFFGVLGGLPLGWVLLAYVNMGALMVLAGTMGLAQPFESTSGKPASTSPTAVLVVLIAIVSLEGGIGGYAALIHTGAWRSNVEIFGVPVPVPVFVPLLCLGLACVCFRCAVRRQTDRLSPQVGKPTAYALLAVSDVLTAGFLASVPPAFMGLTRRLAIFWLVHMCVSLALVLGLTANRETISSWVWRFRGQRRWFRDMLVGDRSSNHLAIVALAALGVISALVLVVGPVLLEDGAKAVRQAWPLILTNVTSIVVLTLAFGCLVQSFWLSKTQGPWAVFLLSLMLVLGPYGLVYYPLLVRIPSNPEWIAAASPAFHVARWLQELPTADFEIGLFLAPYVLLLAYTWLRFRVRLRRMEAGVAQKLRQMGYTPQKSAAVDSSLTGK